MDINPTGVPHGAPSFITAGIFFVAALGFYEIAQLPCTAKMREMFCYIFMVLSALVGIKFLTNDRKA